jgi:hypothetical protein
VQRRGRPRGSHRPLDLPVSGAEANDHWFLSERPQLWRSPAIRLAGAAALGLDEVSVADL